MFSLQIEHIAALIFALALLHTFSVSYFAALAKSYPKHSGLLHLLSEVEVVFGFWAFILVGAMAVLQSGPAALAYAESRQYTEPLFVFVVMVMAASRPVLFAVTQLVNAMASSVRLPTSLVRTWMGLAMVPLIGSLITEPAAMTLAALMLAPLGFHTKVPERLKYFTLVVLFVNVSIGGMQQWWLQPLLTQLSPNALFGSALGLTAITDNAALTYLGSLIEGLSDEAKYNLVAGAVAGGGLTVIANAPNPSGTALLKKGFQNASISALGLLGGALLPTLIAAFALKFLPF